MSDANFRFEVKVGAANGELSDRGVLAHVFALPSTDPLLSWYSPNFFMNSTCSSVRSMDSPFAGAIAVTGRMRGG